LGMDTTPAGQSQCYYRIQAAIQRSVAVIDSRPLPDKRRRLIPEEWASVEAGRDEHKMQVRQERLETQMNALLEATWQAVPAHIRKKWRGNTAVDATLYKAFGQSGQGALST